MQWIEEETEAINTGFKSLFAQKVNPTMHDVYKVIKRDPVLAKTGDVKVRNKVVNEIRKISWKHISLRIWFQNLGHKLFHRAALWESCKTQEKNIAGLNWSLAEVCIHIKTFLKVTQRDQMFSVKTLASSRLWM